MEAFSTQGCWRWNVYSYGTPVTGEAVQPNISLNVYSATGGLQGAMGQMATAGASGTFNVNFADNAWRRTYAALAFAITQFNGNLTNKNFHVYLTEDPNVCGCDGDYSNPTNNDNRTCTINSSNQNICLKTVYPVGANRMFLMAHEYGHGLLGLMGGHPRENCQFLNGHGMTTTEFQSCAIGEGWANFVAVDVFSSESAANPDGFIGYWAAGPNGACKGTRINTSSAEVISAEGGTGTCPVKFVESVLGPGPWAGVSGELDWMRTFWDYHTNANGQAGAPGSPVGHGKLIEQHMDAGYTTHALRAYDEYRQGAADDTCLNYERLVWAAEGNGADHCEWDGSGNACIDVSGCVDVD